jgi:hypothetical protein
MYNSCMYMYIYRYRRSEDTYFLLYCRVLVLVLSCSVDGPFEEAAAAETFEETAAAEALQVMKASIKYSGLHYKKPDKNHIHVPVGINF